MKTIYLVRHQHAGVITSLAFSSPPTDDEMATLGNGADKSRPAGKGPGFVMPHEMILLEPGESLRDVIQAKLDEEQGSRENVSSIQIFGLTAVGHVENPKE